MPSKLPRCDGVYLICFDAPVSSANGRRVTHHYLGFAQNIRRRIAHHRAGVSGSRFMAYVNAAGVGWTVTRLWLCASRADERQLKKHGHHADYCPRCNPMLRSACGMGPARELLDTAPIPASTLDTGAGPRELLRVERGALVITRQSLC